MYYAREWSTIMFYAHNGCASRTTLETSIFIVFILQGREDYLAYFGWVLIFDTMCALKNNAMSMSRGFPHGGHSSRVITRRTTGWLVHIHRRWLVLELIIYHMIYTWLSGRSERTGEMVRKFKGALECQNSLRRTEVKWRGLCCLGIVLCDTQCETA